MLLIANPPAKYARINFIKGLHRETPNVDLAFRAIGPKIGEKNDRQMDLGLTADWGTGLATSNLQFLYRNTQKSPLANLCFGGRQFVFWRLNLSWGCFFEKGGPRRVAS